MPKPVEKIIDEWKVELDQLTPRDCIVRLGCYVEVINVALQFCLQPKNFNKEEKGKTFYEYWSQKLPSHLRAKLLPFIREFSIVYQARNDCAHYKPLTTHLIEIKAPALKETFFISLKHIEEGFGSFRLSTSSLTFSESLSRACGHQGQITDSVDCENIILCCQRSLNNGKILKMWSSCLDDLSMNQEEVPKKINLDYFLLQFNYIQSSSFQFSLANTRIREALKL